MTKIGTVTFHGAQNFGSVLQTYSLQEFVKGLYAESGQECDYNVINYRTDFQKSFYSIYKSVKNPKNIIKNAVAFKHSSCLKIKERKFEDFLTNYIDLTDEISKTDELERFSCVYDYYISGSDQIWNVRASDFESAYYLDFVKKGKKISYAASFGPLIIDWNLYDKDKYSSLLLDYSAISVREAGSKDRVKELIDSDCEINVDPTFLLKKEEWQKIQSDANYNDGKYILLYCLEPSKEQLNMAKAISKKLNLPILVTRYNNKNDMINNFVKKYDSGPLDFLSYIDNAALVLSSSFHGTAFSMIYNKPFYVFNGMKDSRISSILKTAGIEDRSIESIDDIDRVNLKFIDFSVVNEIIKNEQEKSKAYLQQALEIDYEE